MTRVLHVIDTTGPGGAEAVFVELATRTQEAGFESLALVRGEGWVLDALRERGVPSRVLDARGSFNVKYLYSLIRLLGSERIDLIQSHLLGSNLYCALAALATKRPLVATFHGAVDFKANERFKSVKVALMNLGVSQYVAVSNSLKEALQLQNVRPIKVMYNGVDERKYDRSRKHVLRQSLGLERSTLLVGALGNVRPAKAYDVLLKAARQVVESHPNVHFVIAGDDKNRQGAALRRLCLELGIEEHVHFVGFQPDTPSYLAELDVFALSSSSEGFSIATIEAQAVGLPVVVTRSGGPEEIVEDGVNGLIVDCCSPEQLASRIRLLVGNEGLRRELGRAGRESVRLRFSISEMVKRYQELYEGLVAS